MLVNPIYGESSAIEYYAENVEVANGSTSYITSNLDATIPTNTDIVICINDPDGGYMPIVVAKYTGGTLALTIPAETGSADQYQLAITSTTAGLTHYNFGQWRHIYAKIARLGDGYVYASS